MSDDDNYAWLDNHSTAPGNEPTQSATPPPMPPSMPPATPPPPMGGPGAVPPMANRGRSGGSDPLAEKLLATQPARVTAQGRKGRGPLTTRSKFKIAGIVLAIAALVIYANFIGPDTSSIGGLDVGDCFEEPDRSSSKRLTMQDCALPHEGQVVAEANGLRSNVDAECAMAFERLDPARVAQLPADASFATLSATISHRCVVISPSGQITVSLTGP